MINTLCEQLKEMAQVDRKVEENQKDESKEWKLVGNFSLERDEQGEKVMLLMHNPKRDLTFAFYPLNESS